jgi:DNA-binding transcriptional LysR family regulator
MRLDTLDIKRLIAFRLVARSGNLRQAATRLNQTIPAISAKLRKFEEELGVELFQRLPNKLVLTNKGARFLVEVEAFLEMGEQILGTLTALESPRGRIAASIGSDHSWYFAPRISRFLKRFPNVELSLQVRNAADALLGLSRGELDVSFGVFPKLPRGLEREIVTESSLSLVCPIDHPLLRHQPPTLADIARERRIVLPKHAETRKAIDRVLLHNSIRTKGAIEVANCQTACTFVAMGVGIAIVHSLCVDHSQPESVRWIDLSKHFRTVAFSIIYRKGTVKSPLVHELIEELSR